MKTRGLNETIELSSRAIAAVIVATLGVILSGCGSDSGGTTPQTSDPECTGGALEADLQAAPLSGPGVDPETGKLRPPPEGSSYTISATFGVPLSGDAAREKYMQYFGAIQAQLASQPGLVAIQLAQSESCGSGRTLAVWASTDEMYAFVMSPAHVAAMDAVSELIEPNYVVTHWEAASTDEITQEEAVRRIKASEP
ncbi:antibiotic biosynthesis monooxygenase family protein [Sorangium sp. So ce1151]|uniref:antibiotic biosynthesis monooxygenase family protein n=1 Tax=Sorangium sp. So ce1151 TaxID=3133332 RepID=UPI003F5F10C1